MYCTQLKSAATVIGAALGLGLISPLPAHAQNTGQPALQAEALEISVNGRVQTQFNTTSVDDEAAWEVLMRRARLELEVQANELVGGRLQADFAGNRVSLKDAYIQFTFSPGLRLLAGNAKRPFSLIELTSSTRMMPIERGVRIRGVGDDELYGIVNGRGYSDRAVGVQLEGAPTAAPLGFTYAVGVFPGPLPGDDPSEESLQIGGRATIEPIEDIRLGAGWSGRDFSGFVPGVTGPQQRRGNAFEVDLEYGGFTSGPHLIVEAAMGDYDPLRGEDFSGIQTWIGYRAEGPGVLTGVEPVFRVSYADVDPDVVGAAERGGTLLTPGLNLYFGGLNRIQLNYDHWNPAGGGGSEGSLRSQFQLRF